MIKNKLVINFCLCLLIAACAPLHIREHEATKLNESTGQIRTSKSSYSGGLYYSIDSENIRGQLSALDVSEKKDSLTISLNFIGKKGAKIKVNQKLLRYRYHSQEWKTVEGKLSSSQWHWEYGVSGGGKEFGVAQPQFLKEYVFSMEDMKGNEERLIFSVVIPKDEKDLEIEIPEIFLEGKLLIPRSLILKWSDRWTLSPING